MAFSLTTLSFQAFFEIQGNCHSVSDTQHNNITYHYCDTECPILFIFNVNVIMVGVVTLNVMMVSVVMLSVKMMNVIMSSIMQNGIMLSVVMLNVIILSVVMLNVMAPFL